MRKLAFLALLLCSCASPDITTGWTHPSGATAIDGDTFRLGGSRYRLARIDAPELPGHCRPGRICVAGDPYASRNALAWYLQQDTTQCRATGLDYYNRILVECRLRLTYMNESINDALVRQGYAEPYPWTGHKL